MQKKLFETRKTRMYIKQQMYRDMWTSATYTSLKYNVEEHQGLPNKNIDLRHQSS